jgi:DNA adenine methylase
VGRAAQLGGEGAVPFLKWAGGKWAIAGVLQAFLPRDYLERVYREPFLGGGAMFFHLRPKRAVLSDTLSDLITTYQVVQAQVDELITALEKLKKTHSEEQFYKIRERFNAQRGAAPLKRAAWLIYLNKTCYNGLFRTNSKGLFNVPVGRFANPGIVNPAQIRLASRALQGVRLEHARFEHLLETARPGELVYLDPPYDPISRTASFHAYSDGAFGRQEQAHLAQVFRKLDERGCLLAESNSDTELIRELYQGYDIQPIRAPRSISSKSSTRGPIQEVLIRNWQRYPK